MRTDNLIQSIRKHHGLADDAPIGLRGTFGTEISVKEADRDVVVMANTDDIDLDNEVVVPSGADLDYFDKNKKVFVDHAYNFQSAVGVMRSRALKKQRDREGWLVRVHVLPLRGNPIGDDILTMAKEGGIGVSIGFEAMDYGPLSDEEQSRYTKNGTTPGSIVRKWKWIELSFTAMPCNVACQSMASTIDESKAGVLDDLLVKGKIKRESAVAVGYAAAKKGVKTIYIDVPKARRVVEVEPTI